MTKNTSNESTLANAQALEAKYVLLDGKVMRSSSSKRCTTDALFGAVKRVRFEVKQVSGQPTRRA